MDQLAARLGVTKSRVGMWESNGTIPRGDALLALSNQFNVSTDYLLGNDRERTKKPVNKRLRCIQRGLASLDDKKLAQAEQVLKVVFGDIFNEGENHGRL